MKVITDDMNSRCSRSSGTALQSCFLLSVLEIKTSFSLLFEP